MRGDSKVESNNSPDIPDGGRGGHYRDSAAEKNSITREVYHRVVVNATATVSAAQSG